jgi:hypothetical protein
MERGVARLLGKLAHGSPSERFLYVCSGTCAGQVHSCWTRRAKIGLSGISSALLQALQAAPSLRLEARFAGRAKDGGPACATVPLLGGWRVVASGA